MTRHLSDAPVLLIWAYNTEQLNDNRAIADMEEALLSVSGTSAIALEPLTRDESVEMILSMFKVDVGIAGGFAARVHERSGGNPYFIQEILESAISRGQLHVRDGQWLGWDIDDLDLPSSVSEAVSARIGKLSAEAREVANVLAVSGTSTDHRLFGAVSDLPESDLLAGIDELRVRQLIQESQHAADIVYHFSHPLIQEVLYTEMGLARARGIHRRVGEAMERRDAGVIEDPIHALAYHFSRAGGEDPRVVRYLWEAGRRALESRANREAIAFLREAVERARSGRLPETEVSVDLLSLVEDLARSLQRAGEYRDAARHWRTALDLAIERGDDARAARLFRRIGQAAYFPGRYDEALEAYEKGLVHAEASGDRAEEAHLWLHMGIARQAKGGAQEAREDMERARTVADTVEDPGLLARVHRGLMILHTWLGNADEVRDHGRDAITLSEKAGDRQVTFWVYWQLAVLEGFLGHIETMNGHIQHCRKLAEELRSPVLELWTSEVLIENAAAAGRWDTGIALGEQAVARALALEQDALLPRLQVFLGLIYLGRGELELGKTCIEEAWTRSGAAEGGVPRVHLVVPAHMGMAAYHLAAGEYDDAIRIGEAGLEIAENTGYIIWAVHRLLPIIGEAYLQLGDAQGGVHIGERMRRYGKSLGSGIGMAWADAFEAIKVWHAGDIERASGLLRKAAEALDAVPMVFDAARIRRQLAGRLADLGDREGALQELRTVHEVFARMGAEAELGKTRGMFRELGVRPPSRAVGEGVEGLSPRELEIARLVVGRKSNKAIAKKLGISARTVSTHLSNTFQKLNLASRGELADFVRDKDFSSGEMEA